jgi:hypothetical protein
LLGSFSDSVFSLRGPGDMPDGSQIACSSQAKEAQRSSEAKL